MLKHLPFLDKPASAPVKTLRLDFSSLTQLHCPRRFQANGILHHKSPPTIYTAVGSKVHELLARVNEGEDYRYVASYFEPDSGSDISAQVNRILTRTTVMNILSNYEEIRLPALAVESKFEVTLGAFHGANRFNVSLCGTVDLIEKTGPDSLQITDFKTAFSCKMADVLGNYSHRPQILLYLAAMFLLRDTFPPEIKVRLQNPSLQYTCIFITRANKEVASVRVRPDLESFYPALANQILRACLIYDQTMDCPYKPLPPLGLWHHSACNYCFLQSSCRLGDDERTANILRQLDTYNPMNHI